MRKGTRSRILMSALVITIGALFLIVKPEPSSAQNFASYEIRVLCGNRPMPEQFWYNVHGDNNAMGVAPARCAGNCAGRKVTLAEALAGLPPAVQDGLRRQVESAPAERVGCVADGAGSKKPAEKKCEKPTPWFGSSSNCKAVEGPVIDVRSISANSNSPVYTLVELSFCDDPVFRFTVPEGSPGGTNVYKTLLASFVRRRVGTKVCCDTWREAARTGTPCDPTKDMDCDGKSNYEDFYDLSYDTVKLPTLTFPDINRLYSSPEGAALDTLPEGLNPDDANFLPPQDKCDCKWEMTRGTLTCSPDGKQPHVYQASWKCPSTGNARFTRKQAPATVPYNGMSASPSLIEMFTSPVSLFKFLS